MMKTDMVVFITYFILAVTLSKGILAVQIERSPTITEHFLYARQLNFIKNEPLNVTWKMLYPKKHHFTINVFFNSKHLVFIDNEHIRPDKETMMNLHGDFKIDSYKGAYIMRFQLDRLPFYYRVKSLEEKIKYRVHFEDQNETMEFSTIVKHTCDTFPREGRPTVQSFCSNAGQGGETPKVIIVGSLATFVLLVGMFIAWILRGQKYLFNRDRSTTIRKKPPNTFPKSVSFANISHDRPIKANEKKKPTNESVLGQDHVIKITCLALAPTLSNDQITAFLESKRPTVSILKRPSEDSIDFQSNELTCSLKTRTVMTNFKNIDSNNKYIENIDSDTNQTTNTNQINDKIDDVDIESNKIEVRINTKIKNDEKIESDADKESNAAQEINETDESEKPEDETKEKIQREENDNIKLPPDSTVDKHINESMMENITKELTKLKTQSVNSVEIVIDEISDVCEENNDNKTETEKIKNQSASITTVVPPSQQTTVTSSLKTAQKSSSYKRTSQTSDEDIPTSSSYSPASSSLGKRSWILDIGDGRITSKSRTT